MPRLRWPPPLPRACRGPTLEVHRTVRAGEARNWHRRGGRAHTIPYLPPFLPSSLALSLSLSLSLSLPLSLFVYGCVRSTRMQTSSCTLYRVYLAACGNIQADGTVLGTKCPGGMCVKGGCVPIASASGCTGDQYFEAPRGACVACAVGCKGGCTGATLSDCSACKYGVAANGVCPSAVDLTKPDSTVDLTKITTTTTAAAVASTTDTTAAATAGSTATVDAAASAAATTTTTKPGMTTGIVVGTDKPNNPITPGGDTTRVSTQAPASPATKATKATKAAATNDAAAVTQAPGKAVPGIALLVLATNASCALVTTVAGEAAFSSAVVAGLVAAGSSLSTSDVASATSSCAASAVRCADDASACRRCGSWLHVLWSCLGPCLPHGGRGCSKAGVVAAPRRLCPIQCPVTCKLLITKKSGNVCRVGIFL